MEKYTYVIATAFPNGKVASCRLTQEIQDNVTIVTALEHIDTADGNCDIWFTSALSAPEVVELNNIVATHTGECIREWVDVIYDPEMEPVEPGASKVVANDRPAIQVENGITGFASMAGIWSLDQMSYAELKATIKFILQDVNSGSNIRIAIKAKSQATGEDSSEVFPYLDFISVPVDFTTIGEVFEGVITLYVPLFKKNDALAIHIGRDGSNSMGAGTNDDVDVAIQIISIKLEAR